jgi:hypothetical protein
MTLKLCLRFCYFSIMCAVQEKILQPTGGQYLIRPRPANEIPAKAAPAGEESGANILENGVTAPVA